MSIAELKSFDAVARCRGFVKASAALRRTQPTLSVQLRQIEKRYGVELVIRSRGRVVGLTPLGEQLHAITTHMFALERDAYDLLLRAGAKDGVEVRLGAVAPLTAIRIINAFERAHPGVRIVLTLGNSKNVLHQIVNCEIEVGILGGHADHPDCKTFAISKPEIVLVAHRDHPGVKRGLISRKAFAESTLLIREQGSETRDLIYREMERAGYRPKRILEIGSRDAVIAAAAAQMGLAAVSAQEVDIRPPLRLVRFADFRVYGTVHAVCLASRANVPLIASLIESARHIRGA